MGCLLDHNTEQRVAEVRTMQDLPAAMPDGFTAGRQSDFARPRHTLHLCLLALAAAIVYASPQAPSASDTAPTASKPSIYRTVCDSECQRIARPVRRFA